MTAERPAARGDEPPAVEERRRLRRLRALIVDERTRRRLIVLLGVATFVLVSLLAVVVRATQVLALDLFASHEFQEIPGGWFRSLMLAISSLGYTPLAEIVVGAGALLVGILLGWREGAYLLVVTVAQGLVNMAVKTAVGRPRPLDSLIQVLVPQQGNSFPSGHVMFYTVFFGFLGFLALARLPRSPWRAALVAVCAVLIALIGPSRIYIGAHWRSDVIAAYLIGVTLLALAIEGYLAYLAPRSLPATVKHT